MKWARRSMLDISCLAFMAGWPTPLMAQAGSEAALARAFEYAQLASLTGSTITLEAAAALASKSGREVAALERRRQDDLLLLAGADRRFEQALLVPESAGAETRAQITAEREAIRARLAEAEQAIKQTDPAFWDLLQPDSLPLEQARALLNADEALLLMYTREDATYTFAITREKVHWHRSTDYAAPAMERFVAGVRSGIRLAARDPELPGAAFNAGTVHELFRALVSPHDHVLASKRRILAVTSGPLDAVPLTLLPTILDDDGTPDEWFGDRYILTSLATVGMLRTQRCLLASGAAKHIGCRAGGTRRGTSGALRTPRFLGVGDPVLGPPAAREEGRSGGDSDWLRDGLAVREQLLSMSSLPGTGTELRAAAQSFGVERSLLLLRAEANEAKVREVLAGDRSKFISFATHGVLASEAGMLAEPGLVLTPPAGKTGVASDDGYLTASEIAQLDLSGALIILSACNTATVESLAAGRNLNSIARAFQFAGARQLVASHWAVNDEATAALMSLFLARLAAEPEQSAEDALREAQRELRSKQDFAEPAFWSGFTIIGVP